MLNYNVTEMLGAFDNTLSLDGSAPNAMAADLDLNSNDILNAGDITAVNVTVTGTLTGNVPTGPQGDPGAQGAPGAPGADSTVAGPPGAQGDPGPAGTSNLGYTAAPTNGTVTSSSGTDATLTVADGTNAGLMVPEYFTRLASVEASADVTDTTNVTAAGALMDSEVTNLAQVKAFDTSAYATSAQGTLAANALPKAGGALTGAVTTTSTFDGRDVAADGTKLDGIAVGATADQVGLIKGASIGGYIDLDDYITDGYFHQYMSANAGTGTNYPVALAGMLSVQASGIMVYQKYQTYNGGGSYQRTKYSSTWYAWDRILDTGNVDADIDTLALPPNTTISTFGASLVDDADAAAALTTLGAQPLATVLTNTTASFLTADETKLDAIEALADVTDADNVVAALDGATLDTATVAATDLVITKDVATGNLQTVTAQSIADLGAGGGAALDLYAENPSTPTTPSATGDNAVAIGSQTEAPGSESFAAGFNATASGAESAALGHSSISVGIRSTALTKSYASGTDSFAAAISNNTSSYGATGLISVAIGPLAKASSTYGMAFGPGARATGSGSLAIGTSSSNYGSVSSGSASITIGDGNAASQPYSAVLGYLGNSAVRGKFVWANGSFGGGNAEGSSQTGTFVLRSDTTDATAEALTSNNSTASTNNQVILPNNSAYAFHGTIIARQQASGSDYASWEIKGALLRDGTAVSTVLGNGIIDKLFATAGAAAWAVALTADTTNGGLAVTVTGAAATNIRWVATVNTSEVTYA